MALTFADVECTGTITAIDFGGQSVAINYNLVTTTPATALTDMQEVAQRFKAISGLQVTRVTVNTAYTTIADDATGTLNSAPAFGAEREHYSVFEVNLSDGRKATLNVPGPIQAILNTVNPDYIEITNAAVGDYVTMYQSTGDNLVTVGAESVVGNPTAAYTKHKESRTKVTRQKLG